MRASLATTARVNELLGTGGPVSSSGGANIDALARAVIHDVYNNREERKRQLSSNYSAVQKNVNMSSRGPSPVRGFFNASHTLEDLLWRAALFSGRHQPHGRIARPVGPAHERCFLTVNGQLLTQEAGNRQLAVFDDAQAFSSLFEGLLFNFYRRHFPELRPRSQQSIAPGPETPSFLPTMYKDVTLFDGKKTLILDAKCYGRIFSTRFEQRKLSAEHVRQIFYYASHSGSPEDVSALLVYAGTEEAESDERWSDQGYALGCVTLDLNRPFPEIKAALEDNPRRWLRVTS